MRAVPVAASRFVGRDDELADLARMVGAHRLVTVLGPGGSGKTRLAVELAREQDVLGLVELAAVRPPAPLAPAVLDACGLRDEPGTDPADRLRAGLAASAGLLVIDNCEHVHDAVAALVTDLLRGAPELRVLATSRVALGLPGEAVLHLAGLAGHAPALFLDRARAARPDLVDEPDVVAEICRLVDGLPLAVELAAALAASLPLSDLRDTLAERLDVLTSTHTAGLPQHRSLEASVRWSTELAGTAAASALSALTVVDGRFSFAVARAVTGDVEAVRTLVEHSLLQFAAPEHRYLLLDTVRALARDGTNTTVAHDRLLDWVVTFAAATRAGLERADPTALEHADRDAAAVRSALEHAVRTAHRLPDAAAAAADLAFAWSLRGRCSDGLDLVRRLAGALDPVPAALGWAHAFLAGYAGDMETSIVLARDVAATADDDAVRGRALTVTGMVLLFVDPDGAEPLLRDAADLATASGDDWGRVEALQMLAYAHLLRGAPDPAAACAEQAVPTLAHLGHGQLRAWDAAIRAEIAAMRGRFAEAVEAGRRGLDLAVAVGEPVSAGGAVLPLLRALVATDPAAAPAVLAGFRTFAATHPGLGTPDAMALAGAIAASTGPAGAAARAADDAVGAAGLGFVAAEAGTLLAVARLRAGDTAGAADAAGHALSAAGGHRVLACAARMAGAAARRGDADVLPAVHDALADAHRLGLVPLVGDALDLLAALACDAGRPGRAARLLGAAGRLRSEQGARPSPLSAALRDGPAVAAVLAGPQHAGALAEGHRLGTDAAVAYASRSRGRRGGRPRTGWASLTPTEREVVALTTKGLSNPAIGAQLLVAPGTVRTHLRSIFAKLDVSSRAELAALAARRGG